MTLFHRIIITSISAAALFNGRSIAQESKPPVEPESPLVGNELTDAQQRCVERGLDALSKRQEKDGSFGNQMGKHVGITSICAMAYMQAGNLPGRGKYGVQVERALNFVLNSTQESGLICADTASPPMYGHGFAALFLAEVYGMTGDERVKEKLQKSIRLIERSQNNEGGWRYQPAPTDADISVTICQVMALRAARDAGIKVEKSTIDKAIVYVRNCQNGDGGFSYQAVPKGDSGFARSAAGLASLYYAGVSDGKEIVGALGYLNKFPPGRNSLVEQQGNFFYAHYYAIQAMFLAGGDNWSKWYPAIRESLITRQDPNTGMWTNDQTPEYATGMALLILQMPNRYLPVYSGKGAGS